MKWESSAPPSTLSVLGKTRISVVSCSGLNLVRAGTGRNTCPIETEGKNIRPWSKSLSWLEPIQEQGFAIIPGILEPKEIDGLLDVFGHVDLPRSRAGGRHTMRLPAVAAAARDTRLVEI